MRRRADRSALSGDAPPAVAPNPAAGDVTVDVLLLSGSIGGGHDALAAGCEATLRAAGARTMALDVVGLLGRSRRPARAADRAFRAMLGVPAFYDAFHFDQLRRSGRVAGVAERLGVGRATPVVASHLPGGRVDTIVSVFATAAGVAARLKGEGRCRRSVVFVPDACAHRMWVHDETDLFLVTSQLGVASVRRYRPDAPVCVVSPPLRPEFSGPPPQAEARRRLGLPAEGSCVLVMGGAWGLGPVVDTSVALAEAGHAVVAVAGRNAPLQRRLEAAAARTPHLHPVGFSDRIAELMAAADLVVTTAGMTCAEARAVGRGLILLDVVPGHGRENLDYELGRGGAAVAEPDPAAICRTVAACLADPAWGRPAPAEAGAGAAGQAFLAALAPVGRPWLRLVPGERPAAG